LFRVYGLALLVGASICSSAYAAEGKAQTTNADTKSPQSVSSNASSDPFVGPASEAKKLYRRYKRAYDKTVVAIACVRDPKCIEPEDEVIRHSKEALRILQKLDTLSAEGDVQANYYRGLIAFERGRYYDAQASVITHPDFILSATVYRRYAREQFLLAEKYFSVPAKLMNPFACRYMGDIYSSTILGQPRKDKATNYYYAAAIGFIDQGNKIEGAKMYTAMKENANPSDSRIVKVYAKLHNEEPIVSWRKLPNDIVQKMPSKKSQETLN
jgi:hypothetical protein